MKLDRFKLLNSIGNTRLLGSFEQELYRTLLDISGQTMYNFDESRQAEVVLDSIMYAQWIQCSENLHKYEHV
jgi:hypothetical protein